MNIYRNFNYLLYIGSIIGMLLFVGCQSKKSHNNGVVKPSGELVSLSDARGFEIWKSHDETQLTVKNPWQHASDIVFNYQLSSHQNDSTNQIQVPVKRVICLSTTHLAFIQALNQEASVVGVTNPRLVSNSQIQNQLDAGLTKNIGNEQALNYETILDLKPDVIFAYSVGAEAQQVYQKFNEWGIPVVMVGEYLEATPLAKAEWVKFFGQFYQKQAKADSAFNNVQLAYDTYKLQVHEITEKPKVMTSLPWKDIWYVPGGNSFMATFIADAGGEYLWQNDTSRESLSLAIETVFYQAKDADIWIHTGLAESLKDIKDADPRMMQLNPIKKNAVYNNNKRMNDWMGNDFWESGVMHPDLILKDLINIFHPGLLQDSTFTYYQHLQ